MVIANDILIPELARLLREEKEVRFTPSGVSMRPFIEGDKDSVVLAPLTRTPRRGDILLAKAVTQDERTAYVLHRVLRVEAEKIVLQGDGNLTGEEYCSTDNIIGRVTRIERPNGKRKTLSRGIIWHLLLPCRPFLLKIYRHTYLKWYYK
ncbi:MAG: S24/S26 family peptidase [Paludibacteraceae bacterium]|nr:S24/S26 family peptidase [Paludibacteraceae bacterium]